MPDKSKEVFGLEMDEAFFKENQKVLQHIANGISRLLILWIIRYNENIHGYGIIKELNTFFERPIEEGIIKKFPSSKVYPILKSFEKAGMINGEWEVEDNKNVKYYSITEKGNALLSIISQNHKVIKEYPQWKLFFNDFY